MSKAINLNLLDGRSLSQKQETIRSGTAAVTESALWTLVCPYVVKHRFMLALVLVLNVLPGLAVAFQTLAPKYIVDDILTVPGLSLSDRWWCLAGMVGIWLFFAAILRMLSWYLSYRVFTSVRENVVMDLRSRCFRHINQLCMGFHGKHSSGDLFSYVLGSPIGIISGYYHNLMMNVPNAASAFICCTLWIFMWDWCLTILLVSLVFATVFVIRLSHSELEKLQSEFQAVEMKVTGKVSDLFRGNREMKMHAVEDRMTEVFDEQAEALRLKTYDRDIRTHHVNMFHEGVGCIFFVFVIVLASWRYLEQVITAGEFFGYLGAYIALQGPVGLLFSLGTGRANAEVSAKRLLELLYTVSSTPDPRDNIRIPSPREDITFRDVSFSYDHTPVLHNIDLVIPYGQRVALVGPSGAGKSTLAKLAMRLYDAGSGTVYLGNHNVRECRSSDIRRRFGVVPQDPFFFHASIRENLLLICPGATEADLRSVCQTAKMWDFIEQLPQKLDTVIGEGGCRLSGGQRQRLAIARALLNQPDYFLFDEATSALDCVNEALVREALDHVVRNRTAIFVAHRLTTIKDCDRILVIDNGSIIQDGTFKELSSRPGMFREMVNQNRF
ncbi:hypothetical protein DB346_22745 [Verrucomicrobia bacterium LW23]|nr:hypothetical protein DB346_22745 [Verrucomicrobia bacterium LW23]